MELARIDHIRNPHALALGLILPIRWRWALSEEVDFVILTGAKLLEAAGIEVRNQRPGRAWTTLRQNLDALQRVGGLGRFEWEGTNAWTLNGRCRLYQPQWARERMIHGIMPPETTPPPSILTGGEFATWRKSKGWTQEQAAEVLGVSRWTIHRAEATPDEALKKSLDAALHKLR
jgi:DNA-binding XRE family transcriptional regulator